MSRWKSKATFALCVTGFFLAASLWLVSADRAIDTDHGTLKIHVRKAGLFSAAGHDHWVTAPFDGGAINDSDLPQATFRVDARSMLLQAARSVSKASLKLAYILVSGTAIRVGSPQPAPIS